MQQDQYEELKRPTMSKFEKHFCESSEFTEFDKENFFKKSLLSVVANSATVEVFLIQKDHMTFLPETTQSMIFEQMIKIPEADRPKCILDI